MMTGTAPLLVASFGLFALLLGVGLAAALTEWALWSAARRTGVPVAPAGGVTAWMAGLGGLPTAPLRRGEPLGVAFGYAVVAAGVLLPAGIVVAVLSGVDPPGGLGVIAFAPLLTALGYAAAAERAESEETRRHRLAIAGRVLFATPAWAVAVAAWAAASGRLAPGAAAAAGALDPLWRGWLALALVWCGLFVLPGSAGEMGLAARPWGGDPREPSKAVRGLTALAHYVGLATVCAVAGAAFGGHLGVAGRIAGFTGAAIAALALRLLAAWPGVFAWVQRAPRWAVPVVLLAAILLRGGFGGRP